MGTRADFYVERGTQSGWLGSVAWDGYEWHQNGSALEALPVPDDQHGLAADRHVGIADRPGAVRRHRSTARPARREGVRSTVHVDLERVGRFDVLDRGQARQAQDVVHTFSLRFDRRHFERRFK